MAADSSAASVHAGQQGHSFEAPDAGTDPVRGTGDRAEIVSTLLFLLIVAGVAGLVLLLGVLTNPAGSCPPQLLSDGGFVVLLDNNDGGLYREVPAAEVDGYKATTEFDPLPMTRCAPPPGNGPASVVRPWGRLAIVILASLGIIVATAVRYRLTRPTRTAE